MTEQMTNQTAKMIFTMGLPGAGKSTVIRTNRLAEGAVVIDPDAAKEGHPDYDAKNPSALHQWSKDVTDKAFADALFAGQGLFVIDGTGTNSEKMVRKVKQAQAAGFETELLYVQVSLKTSLARNAARARNVPEEVVREKSLDIATSFEIVSRYVDSIKVIVND
jgi:predicted kinase